MGMPFGITEDKKYIYLGIFFVFIELLVIIRNVIFGFYYDFFWACDLFPIILATLFFLKNDQAIKGLVSFGFLVQNVYLISAFVALITGVRYFFMDRYVNAFYFIIAMLIHIIPINMALLATYKKETRKTSLGHSLFFVAVFFFLTLFYTPRELNINFINNINILDVFNADITFVWIPLVFVLIVLPGYAIQKWLYKFYSKNL